MDTEGRMDETSSTYTRHLRAMKMMENKSITIVLLTIMAVFFGSACSSETGGDTNLPTASEPDLSLHPIYSNYDFGHQDNIIDIGIQPLWIPPGIITETMKRDAVLQRALSEDGMEIRFHAFLKGADVNFFLKRGDLEAAIGGDMPALTVAATYDITVTSLIQHGYSSIVARKYILMPELKGKKVAYAFGSNAHFALLNSMAVVGLSEADVDLVPLDVNEMPEALAAGKIDAFSAWEPTPTIAKTQYDGIVTVQRNTISGYLYFSSSFAAKHPAAVSQIVASQLRALNWLKIDEQNLLEASGWALQTGQMLTGQELGLSVEQCATMAREDIINPAIIAIIPEKFIEPGGLLHQEFVFLQRLEMIPPTVEWKAIQSSFDLNLAKKILRSEREYQLAKYDYSHRVSVD